MTFAAECYGVGVPASPFLNDKRTERIAAGRYEGQEIQGALHLVRPGDVVLELGAGLGIVGAVVARNRAPARLVSYEANPHLTRHIRALYKANDLDEICEVRQQVLLAAPDRPTHIRFAIHNSFLGSSLDGDPARAREVVEVETADFNEVTGSLCPDVLIMDIEGGEAQILEHAALESVRAVVIEFHPRAYGPDGMRRCKSILRRAGFERVEGLSTRLVWAAERRR